MRGPWKWRQLVGTLKEDQEWDLRTILHAQVGASRGGWAFWKPKRVGKGVIWRLDASYHNSPDWPTWETGCGLTSTDHLPCLSLLSSPRHDAPRGSAYGCKEFSPSALKSEKECRLFFRGPCSVIGIQRYFSVTNYQRFSGALLANYTTVNQIFFIV